MQIMKRKKKSSAQSNPSETSIHTLVMHKRGRLGIAFKWSILSSCELETFYPVLVVCVSYIYTSPYPFLDIQIFFWIFYSEFNTYIQIGWT